MNVSYTIFFIFFASFLSLLLLRFKFLSFLFKLFILMNVRVLTKQRTTNSSIPGCLLIIMSFKVLNTFEHLLINRPWNFWNSISINLTRSTHSSVGFISAPLDSTWSQLLLEGTSVVGFPYLLDLSGYFFLTCRHKRNVRHARVLCAKYNTESYFFGCLEQIAILL